MQLFMNPPTKLKLVQMRHQSPFQWCLEFEATSPFYFPPCMLHKLNHLKHAFSFQILRKNLHFECLPYIGALHSSLQYELWHLPFLSMDLLLLSLWWLAHHLSQTHGRERPPWSECQCLEIYSIVLYYMLMRGFYLYPSVTMQKVVYCSCLYLAP